MGRRSRSTSRMCAITVMINDFVMRIPLNFDEQIENKEAAKFALKQASNLFKEYQSKKCDSGIVQSDENKLNVTAQNHGGIINHQVGPEYQTTLMKNEFNDSHNAFSNESLLINTINAQKNNANGEDKISTHHQNEKNQTNQKNKERNGKSRYVMTEKDIRVIEEFDRLWGYKNEIADESNPLFLEELSRFECFV